MKIKVNALLSPDGQILKTILTTDSKMPVNLTRRASFLHVSVCQKSSSKERGYSKMEAIGCVNVLLIENSHLK